jgi:hypothetical protein
VTMFKGMAASALGLLAALVAGVVLIETLCF